MIRKRFWTEMEWFDQNAIRPTFSRLFCVYFVDYKTIFHLIEGLKWEIQGQQNGSLNERGPLDFNVRSGPLAECSGA